MDLSFLNIRRKFFSAWRSSDKTGQQVARGSFLIFTERFFIKILYFARTVILARLLFPNDFGLFGMATLAMNILGAFTNPSFSSAIVQKKDVSKEELDSAWTIYFIRGLVLAAVLYLSAPLAGIFFHNSAVVPFVKILALMYLIMGFESFGATLLQKEMRFNRVFIYDMSGVIVEVVVTIIAAFILRNAWALLLGAVANRIVSTVMSYAIHSSRPRLNFNLGNVKRLFEFGKWLSVGGILSFFVSQGDNLMVGKLLDATALGFYQLAFALGTLPAVEIARSLGNILFPLYSKIQKDRQLLSAFFIKISRLVFALIIPASFGLAVLAKETVGFVYGSRWLPMVPILYIVLALALLKVIDYLINPLFVGIGRPKTTTLVSVFQAIVMFSLIVPLTHKYGMVGTGLAVLISLLFAEIIFLLKLRKEINLNFWVLAKITALPAAGSLVMVAMLQLFKKIIFPDTIVIFISYIAAGIIIYFGALFVLDMVFGRRFYESIIWIKKNI
jgi:O-antigen/teichoic acid export membrane protein